MIIKCIIKCNVSMRFRIFFFIFKKFFKFIGIEYNFYSLVYNVLFIERILFLWIFWVYERVLLFINFFLIFFEFYKNYL